MPPTHFLCLPLITPSSRPQLEQSLAYLREITKHRDRKIPESAYRPLGVLHLTLGVMTLNPQQLESALRFLQDTDLDTLLQWAGDRPKTTLPSSISTSTTSATEESSANTGTDTLSHPTVPQTLHRPISPPDNTTPSSPQLEPLSISLIGLSTFPSPLKATVLHAAPHDPTHRLSTFALALRQNFLDAGFIQPESDDRPLVLHATLVNTVYCKSEREQRSEGGRGSGRISVDARELVRSLNGREGRDDERVSREGVGKFVWAEGVVIGGVRICGMGAKEVADKGLGMEYQVFGEKHFRFIRDVSCRS